MSRLFGNLYKERLNYFGSACVLSDIVSYLLRRRGALINFLCHLLLQIGSPLFVAIKNFLGLIHARVMDIDAHPFVTSGFHRCAVERRNFAHALCPSGMADFFHQRAVHRLRLFFVVVQVNCHRDSSSVF